jgi:hypothetical protein
MRKICVAGILAACICCAFNSENVTTRNKPAISMSTDTITLPEAYTKRKFMTGDAATSYDAIAIPGNIVKYDSVNSTYEFETMTAIIKGNKAAVTQPNNSTIFSGSIPASSSLNGSYLINGLKAEKGQVIDIEIRDDATYSVPEGQIDTTAIRSATKSIPADSRKNLFYITSVTVSIINYKIRAEESTISKLNGKIDKLSKPDTAKKGVSLKSNTKSRPAPFSSSESKTMTDKVMSVQLIPVNNFFNTTAIKR